MDQNGVAGVLGGSSSGTDSPLAEGVLPAYKYFSSTAFPFPGWTIVKHSQWMILHRSFVERLRQSPTAAYVAAFMEWCSIVDESYFGVVGLNLGRVDVAGGGDEMWQDRIVAHHRRFLTFPLRSIHPKMLTRSDLPAIRRAKVKNGALFARKIDGQEQPELVDQLDTLRKD